MAKGRGPAGPRPSASVRGPGCPARVRSGLHSTVRPGCSALRIAWQARAPAGYASHLIWRFASEGASTPEGLSCRRSANGSRQSMAAGTHELPSASRRRAPATTQLRPPTHTPRSRSRGPWALPPGLGSRRSSRRPGHTLNGYDVVNVHIRASMRQLPGGHCVPGGDSSRLIMRATSHCGSPSSATRPTLRTSTTAGTVVALRPRPLSCAARFPSLSLTARRRCSHLARQPRRPVRVRGRDRRRRQRPARSRPAGRAQARIRRAQPTRRIVVTWSHRT